MSQKFNFRAILVTQLTIKLIFRGLKVTKINFSQFKSHKNLIFPASI